MKLKEEQNQINLKQLFLFLIIVAVLIINFMYLIV